MDVRQPIISTRDRLIRTKLMKSNSNENVIGKYKNPRDNFLNYMLQWDFLSSLNADSSPSNINSTSQPNPPPPPSINSIINIEDSFKTIPVKFSSVQDYIDHWSPLSIAEIRSSVASKFKTITPRQAKFGVVNINLDSNDLYGKLDDKILKFETTFFSKDSNDIEG